MDSNSHAPSTCPFCGSGNAYSTVQRNLGSFNSSLEASVHCDDCNATVYASADVGPLGDPMRNLRKASQAKIDQLVKSSKLAKLQP